MLECSNTFCPNAEFRLIKDPCGIIDLDRALTNSIDMLNEDVAIKKFLWYAKKCYKKGNFFSSASMNYRETLCKDFYKICKEYVDKLVDYKYQGFWWYLDLEKNYFRYKPLRLLKKLGIYDYQKKSYMYMSMKNENEFIELTKEFFNELFLAVLKEKNSSAKNIILDQGVPGPYPFYAERYLYNSKVIVIERDPRDVYLDTLTEKAYAGHVGHEIRKTHNVKLFVDWYKKNRQFGKQVGNQLKVQFEDLILNYDEEKKRIFNYLNIEEKDHINKKCFLKPEKSSKNIGLWKSYEYQEEIRFIEKELKDYLYEA